MASISICTLASQLLEARLSYGPYLRINSLLTVADQALMCLQRLELLSTLLGKPLSQAPSLRLRTPLPRCTALLNAAENVAIQACCTMIQNLVFLAFLLVDIVVSAFVDAPLLPFHAYFYLHLHLCRAHHRHGSNRYATVVYCVVDSVTYRVACAPDEKLSRRHLEILKHVPTSEFEVSHQPFYGSHTCCLVVGQELSCGIKVGRNDRLLLSIWRANIASSPPMARSCRMDSPLPFTKDVDTVVRVSSSV